MEEYKYPTNPVADKGSIVQGPNYRFTLLFDGLVRYEWASDGHFEDRPSLFAVNRKFPVPDFKVHETDEVLEIDTQRLHLVYVKSINAFSPNSLTVQIKGAFVQWGNIWRYGVGDPFNGNLRGTARTLDGANGEIPLEEGVISRRGYAEINDRSSMLLDSNGFVAPRRPGDDRADGYVFAYGVDYRAAIKAYYAVSGPQPSLPRWSLGNWWSRFYAYTADSYMALMDNFAEEKIPMSVGVIDMDWHLVKEPEVLESGSTGWTGYTWNKKLFPDPPKFLKTLHEKYKLKVTLNDHPADGIYSYEDSYKDMAKALGHDTTHGLPIQFEPTSPKFMKQYFQLLHRRLEEQGVDFWWIDWQQGPYSRVPGVDPLWLLNHFHFIDNKLFPPPTCPSAASRPVIFSRYGGPGSHRYPLGFSGDSIVTWESLDFQPYFTLTASNIGYGWWSHDIGGHMLGYRDDELVTRWIQLGCMSPILRLHSSDSPWMGKEPWNYDPIAREAMGLWLRFRHRLLPYLASISFAMEQEGGESWPLVQPMYWDYPTIDAAYECKNQFFFGSSNLIVAPITSPESPNTKLAKVKAWIPPPINEDEASAKWVDIFTSTIYISKKEIDLHRSLYQYPVLAKEGTIIPLDANDSPPNGSENPDSFELLVIVGRDGHFDIIEEAVDDPDQGFKTSNAGTMRTIPINWKQSTSTLKIGPSTTNNSSNTTSFSRRSFKIRFVAVTTLNESSITATHDSSSLDFTITTLRSDNTISVPRLDSSKILFTGNATIISLNPTPFPLKSAIELTINPQSPAATTSNSTTSLTIDTPPPFLPQIFQYLHSVQLDFGLKSRIWDILKNPETGDSSGAADDNRAALLSRLISVTGLKEDFDGGEKAKVQGGGGGAGEKDNRRIKEVLGPVFEVLGGAC
ncbi:putative glycoside hydrolase [Phaeomoniella chlamydospora]|uniref:alpha-glucosidase n=1 Tax=Phaeomoniella chlamydospora TaxID=158046 RepID=A0A0G2G187_PHACM|nr:putative glycoside hydrolase [Phaeomoniella chlamydospora]